MREYALYKGEEILAIGSLKEIAKLTGTKRETVAFYGTPAYKKRLANRRSRKARVLIDLGTEEEQE